MLLTPRPARVREVIHDCEAVRTFWLDELSGPEIARAAQPGQFLLVWVPETADGRVDFDVPDQVPMSISGVDGRGLGITVRAVGPTTRELHRYQVGAAVGLTGPLGRGFELTGEDVLVIGGGIGLAPLLYLAEELRRRGRRVRSVAGARTAAELFGLDRIRAASVELVVATDDGSQGERGFATQVARRAFAGTTLDHLYACGPEPMLVDAAELCRERAIPGQLSLERYMHCGAGVCGACAINGRRVCHDGPVFPAWELTGMSEFGTLARTAEGIPRKL